MSDATIITAGRLVRVGGRHHHGRRNGQDHAVAFTDGPIVVLAVADGVSRPCSDASTSHTEVGAFLVAEVAARAALAAFARGVTTPGPIKRAVAEALTELVGPLWRALEPEAACRGLFATLLLAVATGQWTRAWAAGDGAWGVMVAPGSPPSVADCGPEDLLVTSEGSSRRGARQHQRLTDCVARAAASAVDPVLHVEGLLEPVIAVERPPLALWLATDGLADEPATAERLRWPVRDGAELERTLQRPDDSDDIAVAFAAREVAHG